MALLRSFNTALISYSLSLLLLPVAKADGDVMEFTDSDFKEGIKPYDVLLVKFYAPWCGHCKKLAPEFEKAATKLLQNDPPIHLAKVDCTEEKKTCDEFSVSGFPTLKIFRKGELAQDYDGPRVAEGIVKYMRGQAGPSAAEISTPQEFEKMLEADDVTICGFFEGDSKLKDSFLKVADTERDRFKFVWTSNKQILESNGYNDDIVAYQPKKFHNKFEPNGFKYDGNYDTDKIKEFLLHETNGLVGIRTSENRYQFDQLPMFVVYSKIDYELDPKGSNYWRNRVLIVANAYKRKAYFAISNKDDFSFDLDEFGLADRKDTKPLVAARSKKGKFFMKEEFSVENLRKFVEDVVNDRLEPHMKSEEPPEEQGDVKVVVAKTFQEMVIDAEKDVLIEFYAPWCGHCNALAPKYDELGQKLSGESGVIIAKMDATANDVPPPFQVQGFPTLYWVPKNRKDKPEPYSGGREVDDFIKYIAKHATEELEGYKRDGKPKKKKKEEL
uniref:Protein disulfide-isomerase n=1 Tax=Elaeophora elaphi TaxID=1147741 RepID=A0A0R3RV38_9BILA